MEDGRRATIFDVLVEVLELVLELERSARARAFR